MSDSKHTVSVGSVQQRILLIRSEKVIIDVDLAEFYGVTTKVLNQAVRRNINRFPVDFMFQLTKEEKTEVVTNCDHLQNLKYSSVNPYVFTEHGALMVSSILNSVRAVEVSVFIVRAFVQLRRSVEEYKELAHMLNKLERSIADHDEQILVLFKAIKQLMKSELPPKKQRIGFQPDKK